MAGYTKYGYFNSWSALLVCDHVTMLVVICISSVEPIYTADCSSANWYFLWCRHVALSRCFFPRLQLLSWIRTGTKGNNSIFVNTSVADRSDWCKYHTANFVCSGRISWQLVTSTVSMIGLENWCVSTMESDLSENLISNKSGCIYSRTNQMFHSESDESDDHLFFPCIFLPLSICI